MYIAGLERGHVVDAQSSRILLWWIVLGLAGGACATAPAVSRGGGSAALHDLARLVDPFIGTGPSNAPNAVGGGRGGSVFPGATVPFGMVQWSPDTPNGEPSGYSYTDDRITGFSLTHYSGAGCSNSGELPILPFVVGGGDARPSLEDAAAVGAGARFGKTQEYASPGLYDVTFDDGIRVELTATTRTGLARIRYPHGRGAALLVDATRTATLRPTSGDVRAAGRAELEGATTGGNFCGTANRYALYFVVRFDRPWRTGVITGGRAVLGFDEGASLLVKVGLSYVSVENARANLRAEDPGRDFDAASARARAAWNTRLAAIQLRAGSETDQRKFYTALYHSLLAPTVASDVNGQYLGFDKQLHTVAPGRVQYANFSGWDIYRSQVQLLALLFPDIASDMMQSLVTDARQCGSLPKWSQNNEETNIMSGDPGALIVASGHAFGATNFDTQAAFASMLHTGSVPNVQCNGHTPLGGLDSYLSLGYVESRHWFGASETLEYAIRDFAVAQFARALGDERHARELLGRSAYWQNVLHPQTLTVQPRDATGAWKTPLNEPGEGSDGDYIEGNAEQYTWMVPHDPRTLFDRLGGNAAVVARLDRFFTQLNAGLRDPNFYMGNEPNFATPWLYNWAGAPARSQDVVRRIVDEVFTADSGGLPGNDDLGATSSWFVWAALGMYPAIPGVAGFALGSPLFPRATVRLGTGARLEIVGDGAPARYVQRVEVNGVPHVRPWLALEAIRGGGTIRYVLGAEPTAWGSDPTAAPPSFGAGEVVGLGEAVNNQGLGRAESAADADFDGGGRSYATEELVSADGGVPIRSRQLVHGDVTFAWPAAGAALDNAIAIGQTISLPAPIRGRRLVVLGAASNGPAVGELRLRYRDDSIATATLGFSDWTLGGGKQALGFGNEIAASSAHCWRRDGQLEPVKAHVFAASVPLDPTRELVAVTLPAQVSAGRLHVFAMEVVPATDR